MALSTFVGREEEIEKLEHALQQASKKQGSIVFVEGEAGSGKSFLLQGLQEKLNIQPGANNRRFVYGICYADGGEQNAYQPFVEILSALLDNKEGFTKLFLSIVKETGSDWLGMIPGIGPAITAGVKTVTIIASHWLPGNESKPGGQWETLANQYLQTISRIAEKYTPLVMVIEDAHWIDDASSRILLRIAQKIRNLPLVIVITSRPSHLSENHPLLHVKNELRSKAQLEVIPLEGLNESQIQEYIMLRFGSSVNSKLSKWLAYLCKGNPFFVAQCLSLLEQVQLIKPVDGAYILDGELKITSGDWQLSGRLAEFSVPDNVEAVLEQRINRLIEEDREMLQVGAVQGAYFMSSILADVLEKKESHILRRLRKVIEQHGLISLYIDSELDKARTEIYTFEHVLLQKALYNKLGPRERLLHHCDIAKQLEKIIGEEKSPSRKLLLDTAHHFDLGQLPELAAEYYYQSAQSLMLDGASLEALEVAKHGLRNIKQVPEAHELRTKITIQFFSASEKYHRHDELEITSLVEQAKLSAYHTNDKELIAQIHYIEGGLQFLYKGLASALIKFQEVLNMLNETQNPINKYVIMVSIGEFLCQENLQAGLELQRQAQDIFTTQIAPIFPHISSNLEQYYYRNQYHIGVGEFDRGNFGKADEILTEIVIALRRSRYRDDLIHALNYLAQLQIALGAFEEAEESITEALSIDKDNEIVTDFYCYNLAVLGKLYLEWGRVSDAEKPMSDGFEESKNTQTIWQLCSTRNYYTEMLLCPEYHRYDPEEAAYQSEQNIESTKKYGHHLSLITAYSLRGITALAQGQPDIAEKFSTQAIAHLQKMGTLPALRTEDILFNHYRVLLANSKAEEAAVYLSQAHEVLMQKAGSITEPEHLKSFLERVKLSRAIIDAVNSA